MSPHIADRPAETLGGADVSAASTPAPASEPIVLSRADLFSKRRPLKTLDVHVPDYGVAKVASLTQGQWEDLNERHQKDGKTDTGKGYMAEAVACALVGPDGKRMFEEPVEGGKEVRVLDLPIVAQLFEAVARQSGLTEEARKSLGKGSEATPAAAG